MMKYYNVYRAMQFVLVVSIMALIGIAMGGCTFSAKVGDKPAVEWTIDKPKGDAE